MTGINCEFLLQSMATDTHGTQMLIYSATNPSNFDPWPLKQPENCVTGGSLTLKHKLSFKMKVEKMFINKSIDFISYLTKISWRVLL